MMRFRSRNKGEAAGKEFAASSSPVQACGSIATDIDPATPTEWGWKVLCPLCGYDYVHPTAVASHDGEDAYRAWSGRGDAVTVGMWGECGHTWTLCLGHHKGATFLFVSRPARVSDGR
jgi:hypothetical protein